MGKAQSKRSVDITTENKEGAAAEADSGKVAKIEDVEKPQLNGEANVKDEASVSIKKLENFYFSIHLKPILRKFLTLI